MTWLPWQPKQERSECEQVVLNEWMKKGVEKAVRSLTNQTFSLRTCYNYCNVMLPWRYYDVTMATWRHVIPRSRCRCTTLGVRPVAPSSVLSLPSFPDSKWRKSRPICTRCERVRVILQARAFACAHLHVQLHAFPCAKLQLALIIACVSLCEFVWFMSVVKTAISHRVFLACPKTALL